MERGTMEKEWETESERENGEGGDMELCREKDR